VRERLHALGHALGRQPHLMAVRDAWWGACRSSSWQPVPAAGATALARPVALPTLDQGAARGLPGLRGVVSIYACVATALSLSKRRETDPVAGATTALAS